MKAAYYLGKEQLRGNLELAQTLDAISAHGHELVDVTFDSRLCSSADILLSFGGDGTFLSSSRIAYEYNVPILGVNFGRLGFLAEASLSDVLPVLDSGKLTVEKRKLLVARYADKSHLAHNEVCINRINSGAIGVDVAIEGKELPTYWADGILVSTGAGSTAYNLSVGGPICTPSADVLVISPIAPHNLGVRPLVVPGCSRIVMKVNSRGEEASLSVDGESLKIPDGSKVSIVPSERCLHCVKLEKSNFIDALRTRFFWGQDVRNMK